MLLTPSNFLFFIGESIGGDKGLVVGKGVWIWGYIIAIICLTIAMIVGLLYLSWKAYRQTRRPELSMSENQEEVKPTRSETRAPFHEPKRDLPPPPGPRPHMPRRIVPRRPAHGQPRPHRPHGQHRHRKAPESEEKASSSDNAVELLTATDNAGQREAENAEEGASLPAEEAQENGGQEELAEAEELDVFELEENGDPGGAGDGETGENPEES
jgi:type IV secretory pathway VirB10-like protein